MYRLPRAFRLRQQHFNTPRARRLPQRRLISQRVYKPNGETLRYQAVRLKKPGLTVRRAATYAFYFGVTYFGLSMVFTQLGLTVEVMEELEEVPEDEEEDEDDDLAAEDSLFIPMTWGKKLPRVYYKGSDPEWQEFIKIAKDKERHRKIQHELVLIVFNAAKLHPIISRHIGTDIKVGKWWLDSSFPDGPPQEYERRGLEFGDGYIAWSAERISPEEQWRLTRALWPKAAFDSLWATSTVLAGINYRRMKQAFGWEDKDPLSPEERYRHALEIMEKRQQAHHGKQIGKAQLEPDGNLGSAANANASRGASEDGKNSSWKVPVAYSESISSTDVPIAVNVFRRTLSQQWNPKTTEPPRGSFVVQGLVEVRGSMGTGLIDVKSCYDPKTAKYVLVQAGLRGFKRWNQSPRGGV